MNRVQTVTQNQYRVEKLGRNQARCTSTKTGPTGHPSARGPGRIVAGPSPVVAEAPDHIAAPGCRVAVSRSRPCTVSRALCPAPRRHVAGAPAPYRGCSAARQRRVVGVCERRHGRIAGSRPRAWPAVSWAGCVVLQHSPAFPSQACHDTICLYCDTGFLTGPSAYCNTIHCIAIQFSSSPKSLCHDTLGFYNTTLSKSTTIQSKSTQAPITIQNIVLQYKQLSYLLQYNCKAFNTNSQYNWAVAQKRLCTVFFLFLLFYFFSFISNSWKITK